MAKAKLGRGFLEQRTLKSVVVEVPEWDGEVILRELTGEEMAEVQAIATSAMDMNTRQVKDGKALMLFRATAICLSWVDEDGNHVMERKDIPLLLRQSYRVLDRLADVVEEMSGMNQAALEAAKKNSETTQNGASGSP